MNAEIIAIGTELLLGEIVDTNTAQIARALRGIGVDIYRTGIVGDNVDRIAQAVREAMQRAAAVITTGGLGPTVDDATREGIARAIGVPTEFRPELWEQIQQRFARYGRTPTENNRRQAYVPQGAIAVENPVGTAPAFIVETPTSAVLALPGVPGEMAVLLDQAVVPYLRRRLGLSSVIKARVLRTAGVGESWIDERIQDLERLNNPTVGLSAHPGQVDIRITAKASGDAEADELIRGLEATVRQRLGQAIYGVDQDRLEHVAMRAVQRHGWRLAVVEHGTGGAVVSALASDKAAFAGGQLLPQSTTEAELQASVEHARQDSAAELGLGVALLPRGDRHALLLILQTTEGPERLELGYGGPSANAPTWATTMALDLIRRRLA